MIKTIRALLGLNQEQLAKQLGVSQVTVNRWENQKSKPSAMAQKQLYDLAVTNHLELDQYIVKSVTSDHVDVLYHASRTGITGQLQPISRRRCDFGRGFYMGTDPMQPLTLVCNEKKPVFYTMKINMEGLEVLDINVGLEWAMMIAYYRGYMDAVKGSNIYNKYSHMADGYDIITGYIANDRMYQVLTDFFEKRITDTALVESLSALNLGKQYVAITQKACDQIEIINSKPLETLELMLLRDKSVIRRKEGISLAEEIVMTHRRDGKFFDEILNEDII